MSLKHPHLSKEINDALERSKAAGVLDLNKDVPVGATVIFETKNTIYYVEKRPEGTWVKGGTFFPQFTKMKIVGSTWGGSMIKLNIIGIGMHVEFATGTVTSAVKAIKIHQTEA